MKFYRLAFAFGVAPCALLVAWASGCGAAGNPLTLSGSGGAGGTGSGTGNGTGTGTGDTSGMGGTILQTGPSGSGGSPAACSGLECQIHACSGGGSTKITGKIYDPAGKN